MLCILILGLTAQGRSAKPPLIPLDEMGDDLLTPPGVSQQQPELFGNYLYAWQMPDGTEVIQYHGDFALHLGDRRLQANEAVIWMEKAQWQETHYYHFEIYLSKNAYVRDNAGTVTTGPALIVTLNSLEPPVANYDAKTQESSEPTPLYQEALRVRATLRLKSDTTTTAPGLTVRQITEDEEPEPQVRPQIRIRPGSDTEIDYENWRITCLGDVYVSRGLIDSSDFMELQANEAVIFLARPESRPAGKEGELADESLEPVAAPEPITPESPAALDMESGLGARVTGVYLRGDVLLTRGEWSMRATELYYDFENDRALILDAVMRAMVPQRNLPVYVRAESIRQLSNQQFLANQATLSASEFHTPHVSIGSSSILLTDTTPRGAGGRMAGVLTGKYELRDSTLNLDGVPIAYWPYAAGELSRTETSIQAVRTAYSDDFGATFQSKWYLFNLLGLEEPTGMETILRMDYFSERGPGAGIDSDYQFEDSYGLLRTYYIHDSGEDNLGPFRDGDFENENRGRYTWRHRQYLPKGWELTLEGSYISDRNFLEEYFNAEFEEGKEQETLVYLKKQEDNWAFTALTQWRVMEWLTQTEHFPDLGFFLVGEPLDEIASYFNESHLGFARYRPDLGRLFDKWRVRDNTEQTDITFRSETRNEITVPIAINPSTKIVPFAVGRLGYWDSSPDDGSVDRIFGSAGVRTSTQFWRLFDDVSNDLLNVHGVRHIVRPEVTAWVSGSTRDSIDISPFASGVEEIDDFYGTSVALRQRWQTKRGGPGQWRVVDWITLDIEVNFFGNEPVNLAEIGRFYSYRPENSRPRSHVRGDFMYRISDTTAILADGNFDINDGNVDLFNVSYAVEHTPRLSYFVGFRFIGDTDSNLVGAGANYQINRKYTMAVRTYYDIHRGQTEKFDITFIRKFPRWYGALTFAVDEIEDDFGLSLSVWPEGAPQAAIGSRKFTGLSESTAIRPQE